MTYLRRVPLLAAVLTTLGLASVAHASSPAGVWARVDQVTFDPNMKVPVVRIDGVFMVANQKPDFPNYPGYSVPQYGYMLYNCALPKEQPMCLMQWDELKTIAGTADNCRGWGDNSQPNNGTVRPAMDPEQKPDPYPIALGVVPGFSPCEALKAWQVENPPPDDPPPGTTTGEPGSTGELGSTGGDPGSTGTPGTSTAPGSTSGEPGSTSGTPATTDPGTGGTGGGSDTATATSAPTEGGAASTSGGNNTSPTATATDTSGADDKGGCACDTAAPARPGLTALALLGVLGLRRRRRA